MSVELHTKPINIKIMKICHINTLSIASLAFVPRGVLAATAALSMSPVARWHKQYSSLISGDWVPLPDPGGPENQFHMMIIKLEFKLNKAWTKNNEKAIRSAIFIVFFTH